MKLKLLVFALILLNAKFINGMFSKASIKIYNAAIHGNLQEVKEAIDEEVSKDDIQDALDSAIYNDHFELVQFLLNKGAEINTKYKFCILEHTPLMKAANNNKIKIVELLLINGADINQTDKYSETALSIAKNNGYSQIVQILEEWPIKVKILQKDISKKLKEADVVPNIEEIRDIIAEYTVGLYS